MNSADAVSSYGKSSLNYVWSRTCKFNVIFPINCIFYHSATSIPRIPISLSWHFWSYRQQQLFPQFKFAKRSEVTTATVLNTGKPLNSLRRELRMMRMNSKGRPRHAMCNSIRSWRRKGILDFTSALTNDTEKTRSPKGKTQLAQCVNLGTILLKPHSRRCGTYISQTKIGGFVWVNIRPLSTIRGMGRGWSLFSRESKHCAKLWNEPEM
jgi:hypothetical protein